MTTAPLPLPRFPIPKEPVEANWSGGGFGWLSAVGSAYSGVFGRYDSVSPLIADDAAMSPFDAFQPFAKSHWPTTPADAGGGPMPAAAQASATATARERGITAAGDENRFVMANAESMSWGTIGCSMATSAP